MAAGAKQQVVTEPLKVLEVREKSLKVRQATGGDSFWLPKSQIIEPDVDTLEVGDEEELVIPTWLAQEKGLE